MASIYTDGACIHNPGPGGFAAIIELGSVLYTVRGGEPDTTNNRMEMRAAIEPLLALDGLPGARDSVITVYSDSAYLVNAFNGGWLEKWQRNGWRNKNKGRVKNQDLWRDLLAAVRGRSVSFVWIKGHANHRMNEACDRISNEQARRAVGRTEPFMASNVPKVESQGERQRASAASLTDW